MEAAEERRGGALVLEPRFGKGKGAFAAVNKLSVSWTDCCQRHYALNEISNNVHTEA